jgi:excisionase family DNA binding protein
MPYTEDDPFLKTDSIAKMFDVKPETVRDWIRDGKLEGAIRIGGSLRVPLSEVKKMGERKYG